MQPFLRCSNQEVANSLRDGIPDISDCDLEVSIDSSSDLSHKEVGTLTHRHLLGRALLLLYLLLLGLPDLRTLDAVGIRLLGLLRLCLGDDIGALGQVI